MLLAVDTLAEYIGAEPAAKFFQAVAVEREDEPLEGVVEISVYLTAWVRVEESLRRLDIELRQPWVFFELFPALFLSCERAPHAAEATLGVEVSLLVVVERVATDAALLQELGHVVG